MTFKTALILGRVSNLPTIWTNVAAAAVICGFPASISGGEKAAAFLWACVSISLFYIGGMYLNDAFDRKIDAVERPRRPIPAGLVGARSVFVAGYTMLAAGMLILIILSSLYGSTFWGPFFATTLAAAIIFYDVYHKKNPFGPVVMGLCRALVYAAVAFSLCGATCGDSPGLLSAALALWCYIIGLSYIARQENLSNVKNLWPLLFLLAPLALAGIFIASNVRYFDPGKPVAAAKNIEMAALILALAGTTARSYYILRYKKGAISHAVSVMLAGICLVDALVMSMHGQSFALVAGLAGFVLTRLFQRYIPGT